MSETDSPAFTPGAFCWNELVTSDAAAAKAFYQTTFGWTAESVAMAPGFEYTLFKLGGQVVAGMIEIAAGMKIDQPRWLTYVSSTDVAADVAKAKAAGATILRDELKVPSGGTLAIIQDPLGAVFGLWKNPENACCG